MVTWGSDHTPINSGTLGDFAEKYQECRPCYQCQERKAHTPWYGIKDFHDLALHPSVC